MKKKLRRNVAIYQGETLLAKNTETGEIREGVEDVEDLEKRVVLRRTTLHKRLLADGTVLFLPDVQFVRLMPFAWDFLDGVLTRLEASCARTLAKRAARYTNSLAPISGKTSGATWMQLFDLSKTKVKPIVRMLVAAGVCGPVDDEVYAGSWALNPYLQFSGRTMRQSTLQYFDATHAGKAFFDTSYKVSREQLELEAEQVQLKSSAALTRRERKAQSL